MAALPQTRDQLTAVHCTPQHDALSDEQVGRLLALLDGWTIENGRLVKIFPFKNYFRTLAFVNGIAYMIHIEDHHPELLVEYGRCTVRYHTHSVNGGQGGLSVNDFLCAAKIDAIVAQSSAAA